ncbi:hypothetical protein POM88_033362 [Heracleum sosnowskyi]|uniref:Uncharacterized protein n=1 Tax=Heracleum sosnowskyi TaxID=360622 RepID=A0AAD8I117_9APIA|nr:hypothetical protein POM88_033362 [Heracleum sosnowskyi]
MLSEQQFMYGVELCNRQNPIETIKDSQGAEGEGVTTGIGACGWYQEQSGHLLSFPLNKLIEQLMRRSSQETANAEGCSFASMNRLIGATKQVKRQFVTTHQLQQQKRNKKSTEVYTPRKSARLNNAQVTIPNQVKSSRKPELLKNQQTRRNSEAEVTSARNSARLVGARPEIIDAALKQKPKSVEEKSAQKSALIKNSQGIDENVDLKSGSVRRKLDLHNSIDAGKDVDEGEDVDGDENMDENDMEDDVLPPPPPLSPSSPIKPMKLSKYEMIKFLNMERNRQRCRALGVPELAVGVSAAFKKDKGKSKGKKNIRDEDEYIEESEEQSEDDASEILPKNDKNEAAANSGMVEPAKTQLPCCQGLGSMVDYLAMRERKQKEAASAIATGSGTKNDKVPETDLPDIEMEEVEADDEQPDDQQPDDQQPDGEQPDGEQMTTYTMQRFLPKLDTINKKLGSSEGLDGLDELVSGAKKSHGRGWLIGRHDPKCLKTSTSAPAPTDSYVQELTKKIRQEVAVEVEAKPCAGGRRRSGRLVYSLLFNWTRKQPAYVDLGEEGSNVVGQVAPYLNMGQKNAYGNIHSGVKIARNIQTRVESTKILLVMEEMDTRDIVSDEDDFVTQAEKIIMVPYTYTEFIDGLTFLVKDKFVTISRINDAVKRNI